MHYVELDVNNLAVAVGSPAPPARHDERDRLRRLLLRSPRQQEPGRRRRGESRAGARTAILVHRRRLRRRPRDRRTGIRGLHQPDLETAGRAERNGVLDTGEDVNGNGVLDAYGGVPRARPDRHRVPWPWNGHGYRACGRDDWATGAWARARNAHDRGPVADARVNPPRVLPPRAQGRQRRQRGQLPAQRTQGLTIAAENPLYVQGNYNAPNAARHRFRHGRPGDRPTTARRHRVIADAVTLLSNDFNDIGSFRSAPIASPHEPDRQAAHDRGIASAIIAGKGLNFPRPTNNAPGPHRLRHRRRGAQLPALHRELGRTRSTTGARSSASTRAGRPLAPTSAATWSTRRRHAATGSTTDFLTPTCCRRARRCSASFTYVSSQFTISQITCRRLSFGGVAVRLERQLHVPDVAAVALERREHPLRLDRERARIVVGVAVDQQDRLVDLVGEMNGDIGVDVRRLPERALLRLESERRERAVVRAAARDAGAEQIASARAGSPS